MGKSGYIFLLACIIVSYTAVKGQDIAMSQSTVQDEENVASPESEESTSSTPAFMQKISLGANTGLSLFHGDLTQYYVFPKIADWSTSFRSGWSFFIERDIDEISAISGLGVRLAIQHGSLKGGKRPGAQSNFINFRTDYWAGYFAVMYSLSDLLLKENEYRKFHIDGYGGVGAIKYRSFSFYQDNESQWVYNTIGYESNEYGPNIEGLVTKEKMITEITLPVGVHFGYQINHKADIHFDLMLMNTFNDDLDAHNRSWTADDKYSFWGLGLTFTFGRSEADYVKKPKEEKTEASTDLPPDVPNVSLPAAKSGKGLFKRRSKSDELLELRLKLFETQLKLFEMQYLMFE